MQSEQKPIALVSAEEDDSVSRDLLVWMNTCPLLPDFVNADFLAKDRPGIMMSTIQATPKIRQYINGGYEAQHQFAIIYRVQPDDNDSRLSAEELLNKIGIWAESSKTMPELNVGVVRSVKRNSNAALLYVYEDGSRDYQILMTMIYEVI